MIKISFNFCTNRNITARSYSWTTLIQKNSEKGKVQAATPNDNIVSIAPHIP